MHGGLHPEQGEATGQAPGLNEVVRLLARLGGFLARKGDGEPSVNTTKLGMQRIVDFAAGIKFSRELLALGTSVQRDGYSPGKNSDRNGWATARDNNSEKPCHGQSP